MITLCLNMIVKNEAKIIERALTSVKDYIDYWVISDTGSNDGTENIIQEFFDRHQIPGELTRTAWQDFGFNRTVALKQARNKGDYILLMDADMVLIVDDPNFKQRLASEVYLVYQGTELTYANPRIIKGSLEVEYRGVTHEYLHIPQANREILTGIKFIEYCDGGNRPEKFQRDIQLLEAGLKTEPENERYWFYLGQTYKDLKQYDKAIICYKKRLELGLAFKEKAWREEMYYSLYMLGYCHQMGNNWAAALAYYLEAYEYYPRRAEAVYAITQYYRSLKKYKLAYQFAQWGLNISYPADDILFVSHDVYAYKFLYELSILFYYLDEKNKGYLISELLIHDRDRQVSESIRQNIHSSLFFYIPSLEEQLVPNVDRETDRETIVEFQALTVSKNKPEYKLTNPSIIFSPVQDQYLINVREVNYTFHLEENRYEYDDRVITYNHILAIDTATIKDDFNSQPLNPNDHEHMQEYAVLESQNTPPIPTYPSPVIGYEDMRLIQLDGQLWGLAATRMMNVHNRYEMVLCRLTPVLSQDSPGGDTNPLPRQIQHYVIDRVLKLHGVEDEKHQKNWMPLIYQNTLYLIYQMEPLTILRPDLETGHCDRIHESRIDLNLQRYRGGSQLVAYRSGYLTIVHEMIWQNNRRYYFHRFVYLKPQYPIDESPHPQLQVAEISPLFYLKEKSVEYVCGLTMTPDNQHLLISFGVNDREAYLAKLPIGTLNTFLTLRHQLATDSVSLGAKHLNKMTSTQPFPL